MSFPARCFPRAERRLFPRAGLLFPAHRVLYIGADGGARGTQQWQTTPTPGLGSSRWRAPGPGDEPAAQAFARDAYDGEETAAYTATHADDEQQAVLDTARGAAQLHGELCAELRGEATASAGQSASAVARAANTEVLHATNAEVPDEVDEDGDDKFTDFDGDEDAPNPANEQWALMASFETARRDRVVHQFMTAERQAHQEIRDMWHRTHQVASKDMDLMAWMTMGIVRVWHQEEAREAVGFHEAATAKVEADALADAAAEAARAWAV
jgi:hypothetical protein